MKEKDLINYAKTLLTNTLIFDEKTISELAYEEIKSKKTLLEDVFLRNKNKDKKAFFIFGGYGLGKKEFASALNELYQIDFIEHTEIKKYCKYYNGTNSHLFEKASLEGVNILMNTVLNKSYSFILDGKFFEFIDSALEKNYDIEINFVYRPLDIAIKSIEILENTFYSGFISSINAVNTIKEKHSNIRVNFYDLHNDLILKNINSLDEVINKSEIMQNDIKFAKDFLLKNCDLAFRKLQEIINTDYPIKKIKLSDTMKKNLDKLGIKYSE
ncbi:zeta toxin family protein [Malaciobacter marinus]|uniref:zeta toxin family protein n=1 Tax=Malaciobacter marinus TaxID=505249 RepID=UPI003B001D18